MRSNRWSDVRERRDGGAAGSGCRRLRGRASRGRDDRAGGDLRPAVVRLQHGSGRSRIPLGRPPPQRHEGGRHGDGDLLRPGERCHGAGVAVHDSGAEPGVLRQRSPQPLRRRSRIVRADPVRDHRLPHRLVEREQRERVRVGRGLGTVAAGDRRLAGAAGWDPGSARAQHELGDGLPDQRRLHEPGDRRGDRDGDPAARGRIVDRDDDLPGAPRQRLPTGLARRFSRAPPGRRTRTSSSSSRATSRSSPSRRSSTTPRATRSRSSRRRTRPARS